MNKTALLLTAMLLAPSAPALAYENFQFFQVYQPNTPWFRSSANGWGKAALVAATAYKYNGTTYVGYINIPAGSHSFKVDTSTTGNWSTNYGDSWLGDACMDSNAANVPLTQGAGTYEIRFNTGAAGYGCGRPFYSAVRLNGFTAAQRTVYLRTNVDNKWEHHLPMYLVRNNVWEAPLMVKPNTFFEFKFDVRGDWTLNFGRSTTDMRASLNVGRAVQGGPNIQLYAEDYTGLDPVERRVRFNDATLEYAVCPNASAALCQ